jgi:hypothetical protein
MILNYHYTERDKKFQTLTENGSFIQVNTCRQVVAFGQHEAPQSLEVQNPEQKSRTSLILKSRTELNQIRAILPVAQGFLENSAS